MNPKLMFFILLAAVASCTETSDFTLDYKYDYYPVEKGHTTYYEVDTIKYSALLDGGHDTFSWEVKEVIGDAFTDAGGRTAYRLERYSRKPGSGKWGTPEIGVLVKTDTRVEYQLSNVRLIPFVFPPVKGNSWNGAAFIPDNDTFDFYRDWENTFVEIDQAYELNGQSFDETVLVSDVDSENLLEYKFSESRYASDVGLIERTQFNLKFVGSVIPNEPWEEKATNGFILHQRLTHYE